VNEWINFLFRVNICCILAFRASYTAVRGLAASQSNPVVTTDYPLMLMIIFIHHQAVEKKIITTYASTVAVLFIVFVVLFVGLFVDFFKLDVFFSWRFFLLNFLFGLMQRIG